ncbi:nucleotide excision repair endonuclease [Subsaximicrobium wynnwilliamsii]|uniref:Excinuclease cho n=1 Tax=Subsaximicrobium wynnwilliamsii TaxID=291179 RepID=A0A5C6ZMP2_9FLAO|nr:GIY-YIG nuclease family protein [Subsaximicrobium wynnwilliamsii]TXD84286.1 nucleotide excision repair endonuclease [Subsaximicrobium wynnwilliamsii]TXD89907.1 nucleotide excision repair endonuclease [Subsaximicrobium wynnwilliamsii]TXE03998.1 nucleotide excision repair endonuclease [Subsaximicrobium wynnwilliamsii]
MTSIYIQTLSTGKKAEIPYRISLKNDEHPQAVRSFDFRPEVSVPKRIYEQHNLDRMALLAAPPFCDIADELIELLQEQALVFSEVRQFKLLKSQFKAIGYNFNVRPKFVWHRADKDTENAVELVLRDARNLCAQSLEYAEAFLEVMQQFLCNRNMDSPAPKPTAALTNRLDLSRYKMAAGVYYFLNPFEDVIYVGKAKNIRKRLQSHFSTASLSNINYAEVNAINVDYSGNDLMAQLMESANIKALKPIYNTQQVKDPAPYIINKGKTASGINKLQITRKEIVNNMPERYFNRTSVKQSLEQFCAEHQLCRKHCALERVKGPCSNHTKKHQACVCAGTESTEDYNTRFERAFEQFQNRKSRVIYKLKGRHTEEDAFIYMVNGIYEGYGFIDKTEIIANENDILGHLTPQTNNYDTSRILSDLSRKVKAEHIFSLP